MYCAYNHAYNLYRQFFPIYDCHATRLWNVRIVGVRNYSRNLLLFAKEQTIFKLLENWLCNRSIDYSSMYDIYLFYFEKIVFSYIFKILKYFIFSTFFTRIIISQFRLFFRSLRNKYRSNKANYMIRVTLTIISAGIAQNAYFALSKMRQDAI